MRSMRGFSLIETVIFIVVVSIALAGIAALFVQNTKSSADPFIRERAVAIAHAYMDEIMGKRFDENTPVGGGCVETGSNSCTDYCANLLFNDPSGATCVQSKCKLNKKPDDTLACEARANANGMAIEEGSRDLYDDVDDYNDPDLDGVPKDLAEADVGYAGFNVSVNVTQPGSSWHGIDNDDLRHIQVDVTSPMNETISLEGYKVNF